MHGQIWHVRLGTPYQNRLILKNYSITRKCSLKQRSLLHNDMSQNLHSYTILKFRRRRWLRIKLLRENFYNDFDIRFVLIFLHWVWLYIIQYLFLLSNFCMISCFHTRILKTISIKKFVLIFDLRFFESINRSKCSKKLVMKSFLKILWTLFCFSFAYNRFFVVLIIL